MRNRIQTLRSGLGWTQADLGKRLGVSRRTVVSLETGAFHPSLPLAFRLAVVFGRPIEDIFTPEAEDLAGATPAIPNPDRHPATPSTKKGASR